MLVEKILVGITIFAVSGREPIGNYNLKGNYISRTVGERTNRKYNLKEKPKMEISCTVGERTNRKI